jgi:hypothetical protein
MFWDSDARIEASVGAVVRQVEVPVLPAQWPNSLVSDRGGCRRIDRGVLIDLIWPVPGEHLAAGDRRPASVVVPVPKFAARGDGEVNLGGSHSGVNETRPTGSVASFPLSPVLDRRIVARSKPPRPGEPVATAVGAPSGGHLLIDHCRVAASRGYLELSHEVSGITSLCCTDQEA